MGWFLYFFYFIIYVVEVMVKELYYKFDIDWVIWVGSLVFLIYFFGKCCVFLYYYLNLFNC